MIQGTSGGTASATTEPATPEALVARVEQLLALVRRRDGAKLRALYQDLRPPRRSKWLRQVFGPSLGTALSHQLWDAEPLPDSFIDRAWEALERGAVTVEVTPLEDCVANDRATARARAVLTHLAETTPFHGVELRARDGESGPVMLAWVHLEGRWRYLPFEELDLQDALDDEREEGKLLLVQLRKVEDSLRSLEGNETEQLDWLAKLFAEVVDSAANPLSGSTLQLAYDQSTFLYAFGYYAETRLVMERLLSSFDALAERNPDARPPAVVYVRTATLLALSLARLGDAPAALRVFDGLDDDAARCDEQVQSWVAALIATVLYGEGSQADIEERVEVYLEQCNDHALRAIDRYRPLVAASRAARSWGDHMGALQWLGEAIDEVSTGNPADLDQDAGTLLHDGCVILGTLESGAEEAQAELAAPLFRHASAGMDYLHPSYPGHRGYASLQLCSWIAAKAGDLELSALSERALALSALALIGDDLRASVERLVKDASEQDRGNAFGMAQVAVDLCRRYLPNDALGVSTEALLAELREGPQLEGRGIPLENLGLPPLAFDPAELPARLSSALADPEEGAAILPYLLARWPDDTFEEQAWPVVQQALEAHPPLAALITLPASAAMGLVAGRPPRPLTRHVTALHWGGSLSQLERLLGPEANALPNLRSVRLEDVRLGARGVALLSKLSGLVALTLNRCGLTSAQVLELARAGAFGSLEYLDLQDNDLDQAGHEAIKAVLPSSCSEVRF